MPANKEMNIQLSDDIVQYSTRLTELSLTITDFYTAQMKLYTKLSWYHGEARDEFQDPTRASVLKQLELLSTDIGMVASHIEEAVTLMLEHDENMKAQFKMNTCNAVLKHYGEEPLGEEYLEVFKENGENI